MESMMRYTSSHLQAMMLAAMCVLFLAAQASGNSCGCQNHPQELVCRADFVLKGKILEAHEREEFSELFGQRQIVSYVVNITTIFKGIDLIQTKIEIIQTSAGHSQPCGYPELEVGEKYLLTGSLREDGLWSDDCQWIEKWLDLKPGHVKGLTNEVYVENCDCEISTDKRKSTKNGKPISSGPNFCVYDFQDAQGQSFMKKASCVRGCGRGTKCSWIRNDRYEDCLNVNKLSRFLGGNF